MISFLRQALKSRRRRLRWFDSTPANFYDLFLPSRWYTHNVLRLLVFQQRHKLVPSGPLFTWFVTLRALQFIQGLNRSTLTLRTTRRDARRDFQPNVLFVGRRLVEEYRMNRTEKEPFEKHLQSDMMVHRQSLMNSRSEPKQANNSWKQSPAC